MVGAGVIGCAVAYELARRGVSVEVIDDRPVGMGATQAAAGMLAPYLESREDHPLLTLTTRSLALYDSFVARAAADSGAVVRYEREGSIEVAVSEEQRQSLVRSAQVLGAHGIEAGLLDADAVRAREPELSGTVLGGLVIPLHGYVSASDLSRALAAAARHHGARILEQGRVQSVEHSGNDLVVRTERGTLTGDAVVLAAGSWSGQIEISGAKSRIPVRPVRGQLLQLAWAGPVPAHVIWSERCYVVPWRDGTVLIGATVEDVGFDERSTVAGVRNLVDAACEILPRAWMASIGAVRVGLRPGTPDQLPIIGRSTILPDLIYATGHFRNGILLAPLTAALVADVLLEDKSDPVLGITSPGRFGLV